MHPVWQVASDEVNDDFQHIAVPGGVMSQVKVLLAGVQDMGQRLVLSHRAFTMVKTDSFT